MATSTSPALNLQSPAGESSKPMRLTTAGGPRAPQRVRTWLQSAAAWLPDEVERNLMLLTCELVNNSVLHGRAGEQDVIEIELAAVGSGVRAQVSDSGPGFAPAERDRPIEEPGGWGLVLVERVSKRWGVEHGDRTSVWFELAAA
jgi:anti-sigma regulatory factor (Ser/Thr protein kinase)